MKCIIPIAKNAVHTCLNVNMRSRIALSSTLREYHVSALVSMADKNFGGKSIRDKPAKREKVSSPKKERSEDEINKLSQNRKEREMKKKEIRQKQIEMQKKKKENQKTNKGPQVIKKKKSMLNDDDDDDMYL